MFRKLCLAVIGWLALAGVALAAVNINTATKEQLDSLKGIGPTKAQAIVDYRAKNGPFKSVDDLEKVPGIGPATMKDIRSQLTVTGATVIEQKKDAPAPATKPAAEPKREPAKADAKAEKKAEEKKAAPVKADEKKAAPAKAEDKKAAPAKADDKKAAPAKAEPARTEPAKTEPRKDPAPKKDDGKAEKK